MRYVTNSESSTLKRCARKWYLSYFRKLYPKGEKISESRTIGILVHDGLAQMYATGQDPVAAIIYAGNELITEQEDHLTADVGDQARVQIESNIEVLEGSIEFARIIVEGYIEWLESEGEDQHLQLLAAESERWVRLPLSQSLTEPVALLAKMDARFMDLRSNARVFMDHKVVQNFGDREGWAHLDPQFRFYGLVEYLQLLEDQSTEEDSDQPIPEWTDGGIVNMLRKVKRTSRSNPPFYKRKQIRHNLTELRNFFHRISGEVGRILQLEEMLDNGVSHHVVVPPNPTRDCTWDCPYMTLCGFMDDGSDAEGYVEASFNIGNPLKRYETVPGLRSE